MNTKQVMARIVLLTSVLLMASGCASQQKATLVVADQRLKLRNAAFCYCLYVCLPKCDSAIIEDGSGAGYFETSAYALETFDLLNSAAKQAAAKEYSSKEGKPLCIMKCLDFYNSEELRSLVELFDSQVDR